MVLKVKNTAAATPAFESDDDNDTVAVAAPAPAVEAPAAAAPAQPQSQEKEPAAAAPAPAVLKPVAGAVAKAKPVNMADWDVLGSIKDRLPPVDFGEGVRLVGSNGSIMDGDKRLLGDNIVLTVLSWNDRFVISPGDNGAEAKEHARYSLDGVTTTKGEDVKEYLEELRQDFPKAAMKTYVDLFGILEETGKPTDYIGTGVVVSLAPDSVRTFTGFRRDIVVKGMMGRIEPIDASLGVRLRVHVEVKSAGGNTWSRLVCSLA